MLTLMWFCQILQIGNFMKVHLYSIMIPQPFFIHTKSGAVCFREGTDMTASASHRRLLQHHREINPKDNAFNADNKVLQCPCRQGWHGPHCGIPTIVYHSNLQSKSKVTPRKVPRRVINAININHEFDLLHARFHELGDVVDVFLICESNFTAYGASRPLLFRQLILNGTFDYIKHKILYIFLDHFPDGGRTDGWIVDDYLRTYLTKNGMSRLEGLKADDVFVIDDADEIPARDGILFLKLYDGLDGTGRDPHAQISLRILLEAVWNAKHCICLHGSYAL